MRNLVLISSIVISIAVVALILMQGKGAGLGSAWGGGGELFQTRRGIEKLTIRLTVAFALLFFLVAAISLFLK